MSKTVSLKCHECKVVFDKRKSEINKNTSRNYYCSTECFYEFCRKERCKIYQDFIGKIFGKIKVVKKYNDDLNDCRFICQCECKNERIYTYYDLIKNKKLECSDCFSKKRVIDLCGQRFGLLTVLYQLEDRRGANNCVQWMCKCDCGNLHSATSDHLKQGNTKSCGCNRYNWERLPLAKIKCVACGTEKLINPYRYNQLEKKNKIDEYGCSPKCAGIIKHRKTLKQLNLTDDEIIHLHVVKKIPTSVISEMYKCSHWLIINTLQNNNVKIGARRNPNKKRKKMSRAVRRKMSRIAKERYKNNPKLRERNRKNTLRAIQNGKMKQFNTKIEILVRDFLQQQKITFEQQKVFGFWAFDFYLTDFKIFIECDGDYWHANPKFYKPNKFNATQKNNVKRGKQKESFARNRGYRVLRFWEFDIHNNFENVKKIILESCFPKCQS